MPQGIYIPLKDYFHTQSYMLAGIIMLFSFNYRKCTTEIFGVQNKPYNMMEIKYFASNTIYS